MKEKKNMSSGAEKVEEIAGRRSSAESQGAAANGGASKNRARKREAALEAAADKEAARAEKRVAAAQAKEAKKEARAEAALERRHERELRAEAAKEERMHRRAERAERRIERRESRENHKRAPGFGGWLAAVVSLSVAVLALGAIVTVGYFDLNNTKSAVMAGYRSSVYEFSELVENMDANLAKARVAEGSYETQKLLTDVLVQSELAEKCLESFPVEGRNTENLIAFVNRVGDYSKLLLHKLAKGGDLTEREEEVIEYMYQTTEKIRTAMPSLIESANKGSLEDMLAIDGDFSSKFGDMSNTTVEVPKSIEDGPFSQGASKKESKLLAAEEKIGEKEAAARAGKIFKSYKPSQLRVTGKTESKGFACYNVEFKDEKGREYYAQLTERGGKLALFDGYETCKSHNYDVRSCIRIAEKFLDGCGYTGLKPVWASEAGTECSVNFAYEEGGAVVYPDMIKVKVCEEKGVVTGLEAHSYLVNHTDREIGSASVSMETVERGAARRMEKLHGVRKAVVEVDGEEVLAYEIVGEHGGRTYYCYVDANTGETVDIFVVVGTDRGNAIL